MTGLIEVGLLAMAMLAMGTWVVVVLAAPRSLARESSPRRRAWIGRAWLYAILWAPPVVLLGALSPGLLAALGGHGDHCLTHGGGHHHHLCLLHPPHATGQASVWLACSLVLVPAAIALLRRTWLDRAHRRLARTLVDTSQPACLPAHPDVRLLDQPESLALTVGLRRPTILVSSGLLERASPRTLEVVLAHERAHVHRRDAWLARLDRLVASLLPRRVAGPLLDELTLAREQACDMQAAAQVGDPLLVAQALTEVARLGLHAPDVGVAMAASSLELRVRHLLDPPTADPRTWMLPAMLLTVLLAGAGPLHGAVEHLVTFLLH